MDLRSLASQADRRDFVRSHFRAGVVVKLYCGFIDDPKQKRLLVVSVNAQRPLFFIINSELTDFAKASPKVLANHLRLDGSEEFLDHDSYLDCSIAHDQFGKGEIEQALISDTTLILGHLSKNAAERLLDVITDDPQSLSPIHINAISQEISQLL